MNIYRNINGVVSGMNLAPTKATGIAPMTLKSLFINRLKNKIARGLYIKMRDDVE
jgi:hypothetical protein